MLIVRALREVAQDGEKDFSALVTEVKRMAHSYYSSFARIAHEAQNARGPQGEAEKYHKEILKNPTLGKDYAQLKPEQKADVIVLYAKLYEAQRLDPSKGKISNTALRNLILSYLPNIDIKQHILGDARIQEQLKFMDGFSDAAKRFFLYSLFHDMGRSFVHYKSYESEKVITDIIENMSGLADADKHHLAKLAVIQAACEKLGNTGERISFQPFSKINEEAILVAMGETDGEIQTGFADRVEDFLKRHNNEIVKFAQEVNKSYGSREIPTGIENLVLTELSSRHGLSAEQAQALGEILPFEKRLQQAEALAQKERDERHPGTRVNRVNFPPGSLEFDQVFARYCRDMHMLAESFAYIERNAELLAMLFGLAMPKNIATHREGALWALLELDIALVIKAEEAHKATYRGPTSAVPEDAIERIKTNRKHIQRILHLVFDIHSTEPMDAHTLYNSPYFRQKVSYYVYELKTGERPPSVQSTMEDSRAKEEAYERLAEQMIENHADLEIDGRAMISPWKLWQRFQEEDPFAKAQP